MQISREDSGCHQMAPAKCNNPTKRRSGTTSPENSSCSTAGGGVSYSSSSAANGEDEAMADCLILLARGGSGSRAHIAAETEDGGDGCRRLAGAGAGQTDPFVYQCKTCDRNFASFQALGGHRASHKKPRTGFGADEKEGARNHSVGIAALKNSKIHECSVCGSEFASGQALGGHMRRHRPPPHAIRYPTKPPTRGYGAAHVSGSSDGREEPRGMIPALDLNLPPPIEEEDGHDLKMRNLAFSTPALVDCHY